MTVPAVTLPSGDSMPVVGIGTGNLTESEVGDPVYSGLEAGYTLVDTAEGYGNEAGIGDALADYDRDELFLTSKVLPSNLGYESVIGACERSLDRLGTDYLDLFLVHWPNPAVSQRETFQALSTLRDQGKIRNVGVSNFSAYQLSCAQRIADVPIAVNQIEFHPWFRQADLRQYCQETDVVVQAGAPLGRGQFLEDDTVARVAEKYEKSPAQIVLRWAIEKDVTVIPRSTSPSHLRENLDLFGWELGETDRQQLDSLEQGEPVFDTLVPDWRDDVYGISP